MSKVEFDRDQIAVLWTKSQRLVAAYISSAVPRFHDAEDILQEVALVISQRGAEYDRTLPFENWAVGIAKRQILKHFRAAVNQRTALFDATLLERFTEQYEAMNEELAVRQQLMSICMREVQGRGRAALELRYVSELSGEAIAERLGMSHGSLRMLLHRVREAIRLCIERRLQRLEDPT